VCASLVAEAYHCPHLEHWEEAWDGPLPDVPLGTAQQHFKVTHAGDAMVVSLPGTTRLGDWSANLCVHYEPLDAQLAAAVAALPAPERVRLKSVCFGLLLV
jgi:hypothetical protein